MTHSYRTDVASEKVKCSKAKRSILQGQKMNVRFRKSIKLAPGVRLNLSNSGGSWALGPRGATVGVSKRGASFNAGIPGTGLSSRTQLTRSMGNQTRPTAENEGYNIVSMTCSVGEDGILSFQDKSGNPVSDEIVEVAKRQNRAVLLSLIERKCAEINEQIEALGQLHLYTPDCTMKYQTLVSSFVVPAPVMARPRSVNFIDRIIPGRVKKIMAKNAFALNKYEQELRAWQQEKSKFDEQQSSRNELIKRAQFGDFESMEEFFEQRLMEIQWPRETAVSFQLSEPDLLRLDVDLPEIEDMPTKSVSVPSRGLKLSMKQLPQSKVEKLYSCHVHSIVFRLIGEAFAALPTLQRVVASGYSQRRNAATAQLRDEYLISVAVDRGAWKEIDFSALEAIDVEASLARFELRREQLKSGAFKSIEPH